MQNCDSGSIYPMEWTLQPVEVVHAAPLLELHIHPPGGAHHPPVSGVGQFLIIDFVIQGFSIAITKLDDLLIWDIKGDIYKGNFGKILHLLLSAENVTFEFNI